MKTATPISRQRFPASEDGIGTSGATRRVSYHPGVTKSGASSIVWYHSRAATSLRSASADRSRSERATAGTTALASNEADREFFVQSVATAHRRGRLDLTFLRLDGRTLAAKCCFLAPPGAFAFKIAFNEDYAKCAPGILLAAELIQRFHTRPGIRWMDSCAEADSFLNSLWIDRKTMQTVAVATGKWSGDFVVSALPVLRWVKRKLSHKAAHAGRPAPA